jgi:hypothetical protein
MNHTRTLTVTSLLAVLLGSFHLSDDVVLGIEGGGTSNYTGVVILAVMLLAALMLDGRRWAHALVLIGSAGMSAVPYLHMTGVGMVGGRAANSSHQLFWVWTLMAMGAVAIVTVVLSSLGLWGLIRSRQRT